MSLWDSINAKHLYRVSQPDLHFLYFWAALLDRPLEWCPHPSDLVEQAFALKIAGFALMLACYSPF